jgi:hypothetical protein
MSASLGADLAAVFGRELDRVRDEIEAYEDEAALWRAQGAQKNAPGTLVLHIVGNLMHYIGAELGGTGYVRDRVAEFEDRDVPRSELLECVAECREVIVPVLEAVGDERMGATYPGVLPTHMAGVTTRAFLIHLTWHLGWHLGHIYYHRLALASD